MPLNAVGQDVDREAAIARLPRSIAASMNEQLARRDLLFPVEQRLLDGRLEWLAHLGRDEFDRLFQAVNSVESRIPLPAVSKKDAGHSSIEYTAILARSPLYPEWRREVERAFAAIDEGAGKIQPLPSIPRLLVCVLPKGLPPNPDPWEEPPPGAVRVTFEREFGAFAGDLLVGLSQREPHPALTPIEHTWIVACDGAPYNNLTEPILLSWDETARLRREFLDRLNAISKTLHSVDETISSLERTDLRPLLPPRLTADPRLSEFVRELLLSGNGALVLNNSFVEWCASEALRRAQPQVLVAAFGIRDRPKPFSSLAWFEDQTRASAAPDQPDPQGSLVDGAMLSRYVYLTARRLAPYSGQTMVWFTTMDSASALLVAPGRAGKLLGLPNRAVSAAQMREFCVNWLAPNLNRAR